MERCLEDVVGVTQAGRKPGGKVWGRVEGGRVAAATRSWSDSRALLHGSQQRGWAGSGSESERVEKKQVRVPPS